ncbi:MAG: T9SS type A sorting domain-containing protein [Bacteroidales bacterium]|nr:T9SS type A sorting domain-containing protein [Bacteroidales bacterium]
MKAILFNVLLLVSLPLLSSGQQRWENIIGKSGISETSIDNVKTYDNAFCLLNYLYYGKIYIVKTDVNGTLLWEKTYINQGDYIGTTSITENSDGELIITGFVSNGALVMKLNQCGELVWCSKFINPEYDLVNFADAVTLPNGDIIVLAFMQRIDGNVTNQDYLFCYNADGNFLWKRAYASLNTDPLYGDRLLFKLYHINNYFIAVGNCYYPYPDNPALLVLRPFFIRIDSAYNEVFTLPYGVRDSIVGWASKLKVEEKNGVNTGVGSYYPSVYSGERNTLIMDFDSQGDETAYWGIPNTAIGSDINDNLGHGLISATDSTQIITGTFGSDNTVNPVGELLVENNFSVITAITHINTIGDSPDIIKTSDLTFLFTSSLMEIPPNNNDILIYKLNSDLSQADYDTTTHVYDSLCDHPIVSDTIYLNGCNVITGIEEVPTPEGYHTSIKTIPLRVSPNPATGSVRFEMENTAYHKGVVIQVFGINGNRVFEQALDNGQTAITTTVATWPDGLYIAVVSSRTSGSGSAKFVVKK